MGLHQRVINGLGHTLPAALSPAKTGHYDTEHASRRRNFRRAAPEGHDGPPPAARVQQTGAARPTKTGHADTNMPAAVGIYDGAAPKVRQDGSSGAEKGGTGKKRRIRKNPAVPSGTAGFSWWLRPASIR